MTTTNPPKRVSLEHLPPELIDGILELLQPEDLARLAQTCRLFHLHTSRDAFWHNLLQSNLPTPIRPPLRGTYKDLFMAHYPHWFLTKHQLWFADSTLHGKLLLVKYDQFRGCIEGHSIVAQRGPHVHGFIEWAGARVLYNTFNPKVLLDLNQPVLRLDASYPRDEPYSFSHETKMNIHGGSSVGIRSVFLHTKNLPKDASAIESTQVWPPRLLPSPDDCRVRTESCNGFRSNDHIPSNPCHVSNSAFRIRQWLEFSHLPLNPVNFFGQRRKTEVAHTYGTLPKQAYTPTPQKPWQGIWVGDYNAHGCEFLAILQPDEPKALPHKAQKAYDNWPAVQAEDIQVLLYGEGDGDDRDLGQTYREVAEMLAEGQRSQLQDESTLDVEDAAPYMGRLEAIKLTGDPNVPRGEYTFIAPDLGAKGLLSYTHEPVFNEGIETMTAEHSSFADTGVDDAAEAVEAVEQSQAYANLPRRALDGARVVKSVGHICSDGFDTFIPTQLILINENYLAQYWKPFHHVSFYRRVDLDLLSSMS